MDVRRLRYFVAVAEERHFGRAAERLYVAQPALSQQIKTLESELGVTLLIRSTRRVELTPAGARLLERGRQILAELAGVEAEVRRVAAGEEGLVQMGFIGSATYELMPRLSRTLLAELPALQVELTGEMLSPEILRQLVVRRLDVGLVRRFEPVDGVEFRHLRSDRLVAAVPTEHPAADEPGLTLRRLREEPFVTYPRDVSAVGTAVIEACAAVGFEQLVRAEVRETSALVSFVAAGLGVAVVPESVQHVRIPGVRYLPLTDVNTTIDLLVAWRSQAPQGVVQQVLERLDSLIAAQAD